MTYKIILAGAGLQPALLPQSSDFYFLSSAFKFLLIPGGSLQLFHPLQKRLQTTNHRSVRAGSWLAVGYFFHP